MAQITKRTTTLIGGATDTIEGVTERIVRVTPQEINAVLDKFEETEWVNSTGIQTWLLLDDMAEILRKVVGRDLPERNA